MMRGGESYFEKIKIFHIDPDGGFRFILQSGQ